MNVAAQTIRPFQSLADNVGRFDLRGKKVLIPEMNRIGMHLLAGVFRSYGVDALVIETYKGLALGKEFTSGKECFPCQVTTGDILQFIQKEKERLGDGFDAEAYIYFMPEATGPCRFGMYNKYQRIVLDSFPDLRKLKIGSLTTGNSYALDGMIEAGRAREFRKVAYLSVVVGDVLDRLLWRVRPYEKEPGMADTFIERAMDAMARAFEKCGAAKDFDGILDELDRIVLRGKSIIDPAIPAKPLIGIVGEIYLRSHVQSNQDIIRSLERYGGEVVNASIAEWVDYTTYDRVRAARTKMMLSLRQRRFENLKGCLREMVKFGGDLLYQNLRHDQVYKRVERLLDVAPEHRVSHLERVLNRDGLYSFDLGTEACLSIAGIAEYVREGYNGVVNVYPFTCMPSTITSSIVRPVMNRNKIPFLDAPYDDSYQPGREASIRTFMFQASQHFRKQGRKSHAS